MAQRKSAAVVGHDMLALVLTCTDCGEVLDRQQVKRSELEAQAVTQLPNREAMSLLTGLPTLPGVPPGVLDTAPADPASGDLMAQPTPHPATVPVDGSTAGPINQVSSANLDSAGTTEATSATQDAPINQS